MDRMAEKSIESKASSKKSNRKRTVLANPDFQITGKRPFAYTIFI